MEIVDDSEKSAGAADHILPIPLGQATGRLSVEGITGVRLIVDDREPVDRHTFRQCLIARLGDRPAGIVGPVAGDVDDVPTGARLRRPTLAG